MYPLLPAAQEDRVELPTSARSLATCVISLRRCGKKSLRTREFLYDPSRFMVNNARELPISAPSQAFVAAGTIEEVTLHEPERGGKISLFRS